MDGKGVCVLGSTVYDLSPPYFFLFFSFSLLSGGDRPVFLFQFVPLGRIIAWEIREDWVLYIYEGVVVYVLCCMLYVVCEANKLSTPTLPIT